MGRRKAEVKTLSGVEFLDALAVEPTLLDQVIEVTMAKDAKPAPPAIKVPKGYTLLPGGVVRKVRVNREWIVDGDGDGYEKPLLVETNGQIIHALDVQFVELPQLVCSEEVRGCSSLRSVCLLTEGPLLVK